MGIFARIKHDEENLDALNTTVKKLRARQEKTLEYVFDMCVCTSIFFVFMCFVFYRFAHP
jgi:hypothetical protein